MEKSKSCYRCKFFDPDNICCMYKCLCMAILDTEESAENCSFYIEGTYNILELENTNYLL